MNQMEFTTDEITAMLSGKIAVHKSINENPDSIEIGTPSKGGSMKVYFDAKKPEEAKEKIDNIIQLRKYANLKIEE